MTTSAHQLSRYQTTEVKIDLRHNELRHRRRRKGDPKCSCNGEHPVEVEVDLEKTDLVPVAEIPVFLGIAEALQRLHEKAHPDGALFIQYCRKPECLEIVESYGGRLP